MKKSVVLTILIIYILAIVVVGFIGIALKVYDEKKYVEEIKCISDNYIDEPVYNEKGEVIYDGTIEVKKKTNPDLTVVIKCRALPADATNTKLKISVSDKGYDVDNPPEDTSGYEFWYRDNGDGTWTIKLLKEKSQTITILPTDKVGVKLKIRIEIKKSGSDIF